MNKKVLLLIVLGISFTILLPTSTATPSTQIQQSDFNPANDSITTQDSIFKFFMIGRISDLQIEEDLVTFTPINLWYFGVQRYDGMTMWFVSHLKNQEILFSFPYSAFKGLLIERFVCGIIDFDYEPPPPPPTITFIKTDTATVNTLTVVSADPADIPWEDIELKVDDTVEDHGHSGEVTAGDVIDLTAIVGDGDYTVFIRHIPTNTLIGTFEFEAGI